MKATLHVLLVVFLFGAISIVNTKTKNYNTEIDELNRSGYAYTVSPIKKVNSKYSEIASAVFKNKLIIVSSKKIGAIGNGIDLFTNEPYTDLYCMDIKSDGKLNYPLLFSRILNTKANEGLATFSPNEQHIYFTRSERTNSETYQLYKADLEPNSNGNWVDELELAISSTNYSIETPHISYDGKFLFFSSNMENGYGGFDLYKAPIFQDGSLGAIENLGPNINTPLDEKYPHTSKDDTEFYFSSKGHNSIGGYDIFISNYKGRFYENARNLGQRINSFKDDIGFVFIDEEKGVFSSNKENQSFDLYQFESKAIYQDLQGIVVTNEEKIIPNSTVVLLDAQGNELERQITDKDAFYRFKIKPFENYELKVIKEGYEDFSLKFKSNEGQSDLAFKEILKLSNKVSFRKKKL